MIDGLNTDKEWQAYDDAKTVSKAEEIKNDLMRKAAAQNMMQKMIEKETKELEALKKVANPNELKPLNKNIQAMADMGIIKI